MKIYQIAIVLSVIAAIAILYLVADYEKKFDRLHANGDGIFRVTSEREVNGKKEYDLFKSEVGNKKVVGQKFS